MIKKQFFLILPLLVFLVSCAQEPINSYAPATFSNLRQLNEITSNVKIRVGTFQDKQHRKQLTCLGNQSIKLQPKETFAHYIQQATIKELKFAGLYDKHAQKELTGTLEDVSFQGGVFNQTSWTIRMTFYNEKQKTFPVTAYFLFTADVNNPQYCQHVSDAFPDAVQYLLRRLFSSTEFQTSL